VRVRVEIGAGERPDPGYEVHTDVLPLPGIQVVCHLDRLPFADGSVTALRANHVLEHQSFQLVEPTLREWARVLAPGSPVDIGVPDARYIVTQWIEGAYSTLEANYWLLGGHMDRDAHKGADERGVPRWIWNAHHAMFDDAWLASCWPPTGSPTSTSPATTSGTCAATAAGAQRPGGYRLRLDEPPDPHR
jgi:hypothetical protein